MLFFDTQRNQSIRIICANPIHLHCPIRTLTPGGSWSVPIGRCWVNPKRHRIFMHSSSPTLLQSFRIHHRRHRRYQHYSIMRKHIKLFEILINWLPWSHREDSDRVFVYRRLIHAYLGSAWNVFVMRAHVPILDITTFRN